MGDLEGCVEEGEGEGDGMIGSDGVLCMDGNVGGMEKMWEVGEK